MSADISLFAGLTPDVIEEFLKEGQRCNLPKNETLFKQGGAVERVYLILRGSLRLFRTTPDGNEKTVLLLKSGQSVCEDEIMDGCHGQRTTAIALEPCELLSYPVSWVKETVQKHPVLALNMLSLIAERAHMAEVEAEHQATMSAPQLLACFLQRVCVLYNLNPKRFELPFSKTVIASRLGMQQETLSRALAKLKEQGIIVEGSQVIIDDLKRIEDYVCSVCSLFGACTTHQEFARRING